MSSQQSAVSRFCHPEPARNEQRRISKRWPRSPAWLSRKTGWIPHPRAFMMRWLILPATHTAGYASLPRFFWNHLMTKRRLRVALALASVAVVLAAATGSTTARWSFDFAQYRGTQALPTVDEFRFVIVGDRSGAPQWGLMPQAFSEINQLCPDFVISVGDLIDGYGDSAEQIDKLWNELDGEVSILKSPFVYIPGNHDIWSPTSRGVYEARYGPTYRSFNYRGLHFVTLDTEQADDQGQHINCIQGAQLEWLKDDIARNRDARRILLFMHRPIWQAGGLDDVYPLLEGLRVSIFAGHYHRYGYAAIRGIPHVILGAVAASMPEDGVEALGRFRHYVLATVRDNDLKLALIRLGGVMSPDRVLEADVAGIRQLADACALLRDGDGSTAPLRVVFRNPLDVPVRFQIQRVTRMSGSGGVQSLLGPEDLSLGGRATLDRMLDPATRLASAASLAAEWRVIYRFNNARGEPQSIDFPIEPRAVRAGTITARATPPSIDGDLSDWSGAEWMPIADAAQADAGAELWKGVNDLSGQFALAEDDRKLYVAVRVVDDQVAFSASPTDGDGVELFTANPGSREISFSSDPDWHRLVVTPFDTRGDSAGEAVGRARVKQFGSRPLESVEAVYARQAHGYALELAVPLDELGWTPGNTDTAELDLAINDRDLGAACDKQLAWSGTNRDRQGSRYYGRIRFAAARQ